MITGISPLSGMLLAKKEDGSVLELFPDTHSMNLMDKLIYKKKLNLCVCWDNERVVGCERKVGR